MIINLSLQNKLYLSYHHIILCVSCFEFLRH